MSNDGHEPLENIVTFPGANKFSTEGDPALAGSIDRPDARTVGAEREVADASWLLTGSCLEEALVNCGYRQGLREASDIVASALPVIHDRRTVQVIRGIVAILSEMGREPISRTE